MNSIVFENVCKSYGDAKIVKSLNLEIKEGERLILLGPSGCGKTTTLRMIAGLEDITSGQLKMGGRVVNDIAPGERNIAMVFQSYALFPHLSVWDNITFGLHIQKLPEAEIKKRADEALEILNLRGYENYKPKQLSGGQKQRVALCRALVKQSPYFLLDEPLSNLDAQLRQQARTELVRIHEIYKPTMIYVTHDQVEAMTVADRIVVLKDGELQQIAAPDTIYRHPANTFVAGFIGAPSMNILKARFNRDCICIGKAVLPVPELWRQVIGQRRDLLLGIRPEHCRLSEDAAVQGSITYVENTGNQRTVELQLESGENISVTVSDRNADVQNSSGICFSWDDVSLFDVTSGRNIGLMKAVDKFDLSYDVKFSTYAVPMITGEIRRFLRDDGMIKVSRSLKENVYKIMKAREKFCQQYQREATIEEISEITKITREEIVTSLEASNEVESIHQSAYQKDGSEISLLDKLSKGENESEKVVDHVLLKEAMKHLEQKEQQMIYYRYFEGKTQQEIAKIFHISQVQVSRIEKRILKKLRRQMIGNI